MMKSEVHDHTSDPQTIIIIIICEVISSIDRIILFLHVTQLGGRDLMLLILVFVVGCDDGISPTINM